MKYLKIALPFIALIALAACGNETNQDTDNSAEVSESAETEASIDYSGMAEVDLTDYNIPISLYIPGETAGRPSIEETSTGSVQISVGERFGLEIIPFGMNMREKKEELEGDLVYQVEVLDSGEDFMVYKKTIPESDTEAEHHFFMNFELEGEIYEVISNPAMSFSLASVESMMKSARSIK